VIDTAVVERYSRAIFELGVEQNQIERLRAELGRLAEAYTNSPDLRATLDNPLVDEDKRKSLLDEVGSRLGLGELALKSVKLLAARRRLRALPEIARRLGGLADEKAGILRATVTSAAPLPEAFYEKLTSELEAATRRKILLEKLHDPTLIAGVVTRIGDNTIDGSVKGRLAELERRLLENQG
jgi:F-type H+-transporting ATPase subunit delta